MIGFGQVFSPVMFRRMLTHDQQSRNISALGRRSMLLVALCDAIHEMVQRPQQQDRSVCRERCDTDIFKAGTPQVGRILYHSSSRRETLGLSSVLLVVPGRPCFSSID